MNSVLLYCNKNKASCISNLAGVVKLLREMGIKPVAERGVFPAGLGLTVELASPEAVSDVDMAIVLGGDGALLAAQRRVMDKGVPVLGINHGRLGFLTELQPNDYDGLREVLTGAYMLDKRMTLTADVLVDGAVVKRYHAINDITVHRAGNVRMCDFDVKIGQRFANSYLADGVIVSTPTGSTAYSLSAGGPIADPSQRLQIITPICPHALYARSIILPDTMEVEIILKQHTEAVLSVDGQEGQELSYNQAIRVSGGGDVAFVRRPGYSFYAKLKEKLFS